MHTVINKSFILEEIRSTAAENGGKPLGSAAFRTETGIKASEWKGIYWIRWSNALVEAGFAPNQFQSATDKSQLARLYAVLAKELGHLPVEAELRLKRRSDPDFPSDKTFRRLGNKIESVRVVMDHFEGKQG